MTHRLGRQYTAHLKSSTAAATTPQLTSTPSPSPYLSVSAEPATPDNSSEGWRPRQPARVGDRYLRAPLKESTRLFWPSSKSAGALRSLTQKQRNCRAADTLLLRRRLRRRRSLACEGRPSRRSQSGSHRRGRRLIGTCFPTLRQQRRPLQRR